jgi:hypothetical protein
MNLCLLNLDRKTKCTNEERIRIFQEVSNTNLKEMKIVSILEPYFKVSMTRLDSKQIKLFQVISDEIKQKAKITKVFKIIEEWRNDEFQIDQFEDIETEPIEEPKIIPTKK